MKKVGIIGAGPAGAYCASLLAKAGFEVLLFDHKAPWEKPCGGGLTAPIWEQFPEFEPLQKLAYANHTARIITTAGANLDFKLDPPLFVISRKTLSQFLLAQAISAGAKFFPKKILKLSPRNSGFELEDSNSEKFGIDFLIGAEGVNSRVRKAFGARWRSKDYYFSLSLLIPKNAELILTVRFFAGLHGYAWIFPGKDTIAIGIGVKMHTHKLEQIYSWLEQTLDSAPELSSIKLNLRSSAKGALIPALQFRSLRKQKVSGENWALIGDASGSANSVTGEGLYYAFKTAELLTEALVNGKPESYQEKWWRVCKQELAGPSLWGSVFFHPLSQKILAYYLKKSPTTQQLARQLLVGIRLTRREIASGIIKSFLGR